MRICERTLINSIGHLEIETISYAITSGFPGCTWSDPDALVARDTLTGDHPTPVNQNRG